MAIAVTAVVPMCSLPAGERRRRSTQPWEELTFTDLIGLLDRSHAVDSPAPGRPPRSPATAASYAEARRYRGGHVEAVCPPGRASGRSRDGSHGGAAILRERGWPGRTPRTVTYTDAIGAATDVRSSLQQDVRWKTPQEPFPRAVLAAQQAVPHLIVAF